MPAKKQTKSMSDAHKGALAEGRAQGRAIRAYLEALEAHRPKRGRKRTPESVERRLAAIEEKLPDADAITRLSLVQERLDLTAELETFSAVVDLTALEEAFVANAADYSARKRITYAAWREVGVPAATLKAAGIGRGQA